MRLLGTMENSPEKLPTVMSDSKMPHASTQDLGVTPPKPGDFFVCHMHCYDVWCLQTLLLQRSSVTFPWNPS